MAPEPHDEMRECVGRDLLKDKEGADVAIAYLKVEKFGEQVPMKRAADPDEITPSYMFFASERRSSYYTGEVLAPIGGETLPG
jgi:NAD(P)-dependent dehydrogenase (short-subunit alcohol dehydrogenase family)